MKYYFSIGVVLLIFTYSISGCNKSKQGNYTSSLNGTWIATGSGCDAGSNVCGDAFLSFNLIALNKTQIVGIYGDTLNYLSTNAHTTTLLFEKSFSTYKYLFHDNISKKLNVYNSIRKTMCFVTRILEIYTRLGI